MKKWTAGLRALYKIPGWGDGYKRSDHTVRPCAPHAQPRRLPCGLKSHEGWFSRVQRALSPSLGTVAIAQLSCAVLRETLLSERAFEAEGAGLAGEARRRSKVTSLAGA